MIPKSPKQRTIAALKSGDETALKLFYQKYKKTFMQYLQSLFPKANSMDLEDIYHQSLMEMLKQIRQGKVIQCSLKTYIYTLGENKFRKQYRDEKKDLTVNLEDFLSFDFEKEEDSGMKELLHQAREEALAKAWEKLKYPAKGVLEDILEGDSIQEVMKKYKYKNSEQLRKQKYKYKNKLKNIALKIYNEITKKYE